MSSLSTISNERKVLKKGTLDGCTNRDFFTVIEFWTIEGRDYEKMTEKEYVEQFTDELVRYFGYTVEL